MTMRPMPAALVLMAMLWACLLAALPARADGVEAAAAVCAACHGADGVPANKSIPVIWGQNEGYLYLELRDYKTGNRKNVTMSGLVGGLDKPAMKALAAYFAAKPWPNLQQPSAAPPVATHVDSINNSAGCKGCHMENWQGDSVTPRLAGQGVCSICARR